MSVETILLLALVSVAIIAVVHRVCDAVGLPAAAVLTLVGIGYALLPGPNVTLDPHIVLTFVLPPLLYSAALDSSLIAIRRNLRTVVSLSVALVLATALVIGVGMHLFVTGTTLAAGIALGAAVAPPDPVAALAVGRRVGLPGRLIVLIQGEGLLNDATALTTLTVAVSAAVGSGFSFGSAVGEFVLAAAGGLVVGAGIAFIHRLLRPFVSDPLTANAISLALPFLCYLVGEKLHVSGVLAVVVAGLIIGHDAPRFASGASRLQTSAVWRLIDYLLEGFVFLLIGQQLPEVVHGLRHYPSSTIAVAVVITVGVVLVLRPLWLMLTQLLPRSLHTRLGGSGERGNRLSGREVVALSWSGTRGVISLAAIFTLPLTTHAGTPFPDRDLLLFCTFMVVLVTLVGQGLTFAPLARALGLRANEADRVRLRNQARVASVQAALAMLTDLEHDDETPDEEKRAVKAARDNLDTRLERYQGRLESLDEAEEGEVPVSQRYESMLRVRRLVIEAQREEILRWRDAGRLPDAGLRVLERELDNEERMLPDRPAG
ncbi:Na+/H+ antiporter [uncultured Jatrophihabitans sp.]|uniref:Na+/H+ antiporter n=1 Tax=uncultured Jatrophihabitans sp. TaxID=1610747 RepID=UPI0035C97895